MKSQVLSLVLIGCLTACTQSTSKNETIIAADSTQKKKFQPVNLEEQLLYSRAVQSVIWGMPAVNFELMHESLAKAKGNFNQIIYWSKLINSKNQTLTPNPDVIYINPLYDTRQGPVVLEIPATEGVSSLTGSLDDSWQTAIEDIGPAGIDKGMGGKYLILPPGYQDQIPPGYIPMPSSTFTGYAILRSNLTDGSPKDLQRAVDYGKKVKIYPLSQASNPPETKFLDLIDIPFSNIIPYNIHFYELLTEFIQREPWLTRDLVMIDQLKTIGIEKGKNFNPDARTKEILNAAILDAHTLIDKKFEEVFKGAYYEGTHWSLPAFPDFAKTIMSNYEVPNMYPIDERAVSYSMAYFSAKHLGAGQFYLMSPRDNKDQQLDGAKLYKLHLPANVPVKLYWSVTVYDRETHALTPGMQYFSRASTTPGLKKKYRWFC